MTQVDRHHTLRLYADGEISALEARQTLGQITYGELLTLLAGSGLSLPRTSLTGREGDLARARAWMFPKHAA